MVSQGHGGWYNSLILRVKELDSPKSKEMGVVPLGYGGR